MLSVRADYVLSSLHLLPGFQHHAEASFAAYHALVSLRHLLRFTVRTSTSLYLPYASAIR